MRSHPFITPVVAGILLLLTDRADAKHSCPAPVTASVEKVYPHAKISSCKHEEEDGKTQYEVKLDKKSAQGLELDVSPDGSILQTEKIVKIRSVPEKVLSAFKAKYPTMKINRAQEQTKADGSISFELAFMDKIKNHEATFAIDGSFVEEE
jgi:hypothetical protein